MQRDKRGRFIKKAQGGIQMPVFTKIGNSEYRVKPGAMGAFTEYQKTNPTATVDSWLQTPSASSYLELYTPSSVPSSNVKLNAGTTDLKLPFEPSFEMKMQQSQRDFEKKQSDFTKGLDLSNWNIAQNRRKTQSDIQLEAIKTHQFFDPELKGPFAPARISYTYKDGKMVDSDGNEILLTDYFKNQSAYQYQPEFLRDSDADEEGAGVNVSSDKGEEKPYSIDKERLANFLELTKAGIGAAVNNKVTQRAIDAEKPFLQDPFESHRNVYGDYEAIAQGEKAAAKLMQLASRPLTADGALQQGMMLDAQIKGNEFREQGYSKDTAMQRQTKEVAWQQNKENQVQRHASAMTNRQAMLMTEKNKADKLNIRDSSNFSQIIDPYISTVEQRFRNEAVKQQAYSDHYNAAIIKNQVWTDNNIKLTPEQSKMRSLALMGGTHLAEYIGTDANRQKAWTELQLIMRNEETRRMAALHGVSIDPTDPQFNTSGYSIDFTPGSSYKSGGTIYKARLVKRTRDNDRTAKSIESSKKIAAKFIDKAIKSLYTYKDVELIAKAGSKRKYQAGGGLPMVNFTPVFATSEQGAPAVAETTTASKKEDLTSKDVLELLKDMDGLPSDMKLIIDSLQSFEMMDDLDPLGISSSGVASRYINLIGKIKMAAFNKSEYDVALNQLKGNGGLGEFAITSDGQLIGANADGDFRYFSPEDVFKGKHTEAGYSILTNSNLLYLRANSTDAAFNHQLTAVAQNGIGISSVNTLILDAVAKLGTTTDSTHEGYIQTNKGDLIEGLDAFYKAAQQAQGNFDGTIHDLYKYEFITKSQAEQAKKAMQYIYHTLPENAKTLLKVKSNGSDSGAIQLIETLISSQLTNESTFNVNLVGGPSHKTSGAGGTSSKDSSDLKTSLPLNVMQGIGGVDSYLQVDRGDGIHLQVRGTQYNLITTPDGDAIQDTSLANMLAASGLQGLVKDLRNIQFGDQKISPEVLSSITYNNTGITRANLPIKSDGSVDLDLLEKYEQAEQEINALSDRSLESIKQIYEKYGLTSLLNADGSYNLSKFGAFMITEGYTTDALSGLKESEFVKEFQGDTDYAVSLIQRCLQVGTGKNAQTPDIDTFAWYNPGDWFGWTDVIYKGVVYIPITNNINTAVFGANQSLDYDEALVQEEKYQNFEKMSRQKSTDSELLNI